MRSNLDSSRAFTLIEIIIAITIIGVFVTLPVLAYSNFNKNSRDSLRKNDINKVQSALELYKANTGKYPSQLSWMQELVDAGYLPEIPSDPKDGQDSDGVTFGYNYSVTTDGLYYELSALLESGDGNEKEYYVVSPGGPGKIGVITPGNNLLTGFPTTTLIAQSPTAPFTTKSPTPTSTPTFTPTTTPTNTPTYTPTLTPIPPPTNLATAGNTYALIVGAPYPEMRANLFTSWTAPAGYTTFVWNVYTDLDYRNVPALGTDTNLVATNKTHPSVVPGYGYVLNVQSKNTTNGGTSAVVERFYTIPTPTPAGVNGLGSGYEIRCFRNTSGGIFCEGDDSTGQITGTNSGYLFSFTTGAVTSGIAQVKPGYSHTCSLTLAGGIKCWGANNTGQLGLGDTTPRTGARDVPGLTSGMIDISTGYDYSCAITTSGGIKCWGASFNTGRLGNGTTVNRVSPTDVQGITAGASKVAAGFGNHTCTRMANGSARCWGENSVGQLGVGNTTSTTTPLAVSALGTTVTDIKVGYNFTCALINTGGVKCWGAGSRLGNGTSNGSTTPVDVSGLTSGVAQIAVGWSFACARTTAGAVWCWGSNDRGQLARANTTTQSLSPLQVIASGATNIAAGAGNMQAIMNTGAIQAWGDYVFGLSAVSIPAYQVPTRDPVFPYQ